MKQPTLVLVATIASFLPVLHGADTFQDFDSLGTTPGTIQQTGAGSPATILNEPAVGNFLRLVNEVPSQNNHYALDATHDGNWSTLVGQFDFRMGNVTGSPADGIGFLLIPQSRAGLSGNGLTDFAAEEPNTAGTLGVGLDLWSGVNDISLHWNRYEQTNAFTNMTTAGFVNTGWNRVVVSYTQIGNGLNATVEFTKDIFGTPTTFMRIDQAVDARPYANRAQFSGRTGGSDLSADIDNILVNYTGTAATLPTIDPQGRVWQDFESLGATGYTARMHTTSPDILRRGPKIIASGGSGGGAYIQLMPDGQNDTQSSISLERAMDGAIASARRIEMDFRMANPDNATPADGMGFLLLPTATQNIAGAGPGLAYENPNFAGALGVGFRVYEGAATNKVQLHWNGAEVAEFVIPLETLDLRGGEWNRMVLDTDVAVGGSSVSLSLIRDVNGIATQVPVFTNQFVAGMVPYDFRIQTGARSGGLNVQADVDNIRTYARTSSFVETNNTLVQDFDGPGTHFQAFDAHGLVAGSDGTRHAIILPNGPTGNFLRLGHAVNNQNANIGFNQVIPSSAPKPLVEASFDFRMTGDLPGVQRADGFGFGLFGINTYGVSGSILGGSQNWENAPMSDALTLGVRIYDGNESTTTDYLTLHWNGVSVFTGNTDTLPGLWDLNNNVFHRAKLTLEDVGADTLATLVFTQDAFGATPTDFTVFSDWMIFGMDLDAFDFRAGLGVRTGGASADYDFDNIVVIPEPGSAALFLAGIAAVGARRRRRQS